MTLNLDLQHAKKWATQLNFHMAKHECREGKNNNITDAPCHKVTKFVTLQKS